MVVDEESTKIKEIGPMVQQQEEQHLCDGIDGPSKFTDTSCYRADNWSLQVVDWKNIVFVHSLIKFEVIL